MNRRLQISRTILVSVVAIPVLGLGGCGFADLFPPPPEIPPMLGVVIDNRETFAQKDGSPVADVDPGTPIDDLSALSGCWGVYLLFSPPPGDPVVANANVMIALAGGEPSVRYYNTMAFDSETGEITLWTMQDTFGLFTLVVGSKGTFEVVDGNRLTVSVAQEYSSANMEGEPNSNPTFEDVDDYSFELTATLAGDYLKVDYLPEADEPHPDEVITYMRFDCPE